MKVLFLSQYVTIDGVTAFMRNKTGYGYMVRDIANSIGALEQVDLLTVSGFTMDDHYDHIHILPKTIIGTIIHVKLRYLRLWLNLVKKYSFTFKQKMQMLIYYYSLGYVDFIAKKGNYDLAHIHGVGGITQGYLMVCKLYNIPYVVTLHGLNSFEDGILINKEENKIEKDFLRNALELRTHVTFISTGIKKQVENYLEINDNKYFVVVPNGTTIKVQVGNIDVRSKFKIRDTDFLFVYVGNISKRKNQIQVAKAFLLLPEKYRKFVKFLFLGNKDDKCLTKFIDDNKLSNNLICAGNIPKTDIHNYYIAANATIMSSLSEGFGLSIIEGFVYGKPNLTFSDLAAIPDLYDDKAMTLVNGRTDEALANGMIETINKNWDAHWISKYAENFSLEKMAIRYVDNYNKILNDGL